MIWEFVEICKFIVLVLLLVGKILYVIFVLVVDVVRCVDFFFYKCEYI